MVVDCAKVRELASEYVEETLPSGLTRAVRAHLDACPVCRADVDALRAVWRRLDTLPVVEPPPFFHENVMTAVERHARRSAAWHSLLPRLGRVALTTAATGGAVSLLAWTLLLPTLSPVQQADRTVLPITIGPSRPDISATPRLRLERTTVVDPQHGPAYEWSVWIEGAARGTARFDVLPDASLEKKLRAVRFTLGPDAPQRLRVPFAAVQGNTLNLFVRWAAAGGEAHRTYLFVPIPKDDTLPQERQSFGLPEGSLAEAAREIAARYGQPVVLEDISDQDKVTVVAREETAAQALERALAGRRVRVSSSANGIVIAPETSLPPDPASSPPPPAR